MTWSCVRPSVCPIMRPQPRVPRRTAGFRLNPYVHHQRRCCTGHSTQQQMCHVTADVGIRKLKSHLILQAIITCLFEGGGIVSLWHNFGRRVRDLWLIVTEGGTGKSILPQNCVTSFMDVSYVTKQLLFLFLLASSNRGMWNNLSNNVVLVHFWCNNMRLTAGSTTHKQSKICWVF